MEGFDFNRAKKEEIVKSDKSWMLKEWQKHSSITKEQFLDALKWVCSEKYNAAGLTKTGWIKLRWHHERSGTILRELSGLAWAGDRFPVEVREDLKAYYGDTVDVVQKIALSSWDRV